MTDSSSGSVEVIEVMGDRSDLLERIDCGPRALRDLRDELGVSRSTIYKAVRELESKSVVERGEDGVAFTPFGRLAYEYYRQFVDDVATMYRVREMLSCEGSPTLEPAIFRNSEVVLAERYDPDRPIDTFEGLVRDADSFRGFSPVGRSRYLDLFAECVAERGLSAEVITERSVIEFLVSDHAEGIQRLQPLDDLTVFQTERSIPFGLAHLRGEETCAIVSLYDEHQQLTALLVSESPAAIEWARRTYEAIRDDATAIDIGGAE